jgi:hypothetical protein
VSNNSIGSRRVGCQAASLGLVTKEEHAVAQLCAADPEL